MITKPKFYWLVFSVFLMVMLLTAQGQDTNNEQTGSLTAQQKLKQSNQVLNFYQNFGSEGMNKQFNFEMIKDVQEFHFHLPTDSKINFLIKLYVLINNAYMPTDDIEDEPATQVVVFQNNHKVIVEQNFYFQAIITIDGVKGNNYMIRFFSRNHKLVTVSHKNFVQTSQFLDKFLGNDIQKISNRVVSVNNMLDSVFKNLRFTYGMEFQTRKELSKKIDKFLTYEYVEIILLIVLCLMHIKMVQKMLKGGSIV